MSTDAIHFLNGAPSGEAAERGLHPGLCQWFRAAVGAPTPAQRHTWPAILSKSNLLLSAPTGSGKTLAAFLPILSDLLLMPSSGLQALYVAPLKALCRDAFVNLRRIRRSLEERGILGDAPLRIGLRTGETSQRVRRRHRDEPPTILLTTPESLEQMLAHEPMHDVLRSLRWVIIDEIHALVGNKRGADLALSLERVQARCPTPVQRIGLSATCAPLDAVARFLVGVGRACAIAQVVDGTPKQFAIEPLFDAGSSEFPSSLHGALLERLDVALATHATSLIFTNTRHLAERVAWALKRRHPDRADEIAVHHSAISPARRRSVERRLKQGRLWTVVSSTSLELGIDIGSVERVIFVHPPGGVVRLLQRVGRSGHRPGEPRRGLILTASPSELLEAVVTAAGGRDGAIEPLLSCNAPLDVLCQQLVGMAMTGHWGRDDALALVRRATPFRELSERDFDDCLDYLSGRRRDGTGWLPARLSWDSDCFTIADARTAKLMRRNLGTILTEDACTIQLRRASDEDLDRTQNVGEVDLAYAERLQPGDRFVLDGRCLEMRERDDLAVIVDEVIGRPQIPRWLGSGVPMPSDLARRIFIFRMQAAEMLHEGPDTLRRWLATEFDLHDGAADALLDYFDAQETLSETPNLRELHIECVPMQVCTEYFVHIPLPRSANEALTRVLLHRWQHGNVKAMAVAADLGFYLLDQSAIAITPDDWRRLLHPIGLRDDFQAYLARSDHVAQAFGRVAKTGLMVLRNPAGRKRKVGGKDWTERRLFEHLRETEPDFVLLRQAAVEACSSSCDLGAAEGFAQQLESLPIRMRTLPRPSPFGESLLRMGPLPVAVPRAAETEAYPLGATA